MRAAAFVLGCLVSAALSAQDAAPLGAERSDPATAGPSAYGVASSTIASVSVFDFVADADAVIGTDLLGMRYVVSGSNMTLLAPLHIPSGVLLESIEIAGCDTDPVGGVFAQIFRVFVEAAAPGSGTLEPPAWTGGTFAGGCGTFAADLSSLGYLTSNAAETYHVRLIFTATGESQKVAGVRVRYRREVSPAPGTATFDDVPVSHPLHRYVEALAASGITAGCATGHFCPNDPVSRGQMAVFLAKALGLHWPD